MPVYEIGPKTSSHHHLIFSRLDVWFFPAPGYKLLQLQFIPMIVQKTKKPWRTNKYQILLHNLRFMSCTTSLHEGEIGVKRNLLFLYMDIRCNFLFKMVSYDERLFDEFLIISDIRFPHNNSHPFLLYRLIFPISYLYLIEF